jgi:hypothetical protein
MITAAQYSQVMTNEVMIYKRTPDYFLVRRDSIVKQTSKALLGERWWPKSAIIREDTFTTGSGERVPVYVMQGWLFHRR